MTRKERIREAAYSRYCNDSSVTFGLQCDCFEEGAKWADKTMIDKACEWLKGHLEKFWCSLYFNDELFIEIFKKDMEK